MTAFTALRAVDTGLGERERATLDLAARSLTGAEPDWLVVPDGLPAILPEPHRRTAALFTATPEPLIESWRVARQLTALTAPGDAVLLSDRNGAAGMFALEQWGAPPTERRTVVVAAADSAVLEYLAVAGTIEGAPEDIAYVMDWELVAYRFAALVAATSQTASDHLDRLGLDGPVVTHPQPEETAAATPANRAFLPEPVSRLSASGALLRGLSAALDERPDLEVVVATADRQDHLFSGTSWQALGGVRRLLGRALRRADDPHGCDLVLLGDPYAVPSPVTAAARRAGTRVAVRSGSTAAALWPDAESWITEPDVAALAIGAAAPTETRAAPGRLEPRRPPSDEGRARRVSVGIPLFRDVRYLDDCVESLLAQQEPPHEILLIDDGSREPLVAGALDRWTARLPDLVRAIVQSPNQGVSAARNVALDHMAGDAFVFVDPDDELHPEFISATAALLRADASLWAAATWTEFFGTYEGIEAKPPFDRRVGRRENPIVSTTVLVDMRVRDQGLRFAPDLAFVFCEDWELWSRVVAAGGAFGLVPRPLARHRVHPGSGGFQRTALAESLGRARAVAPLL